MLARDTGAYKGAQELLKIVCEISTLFPRQLRHTLGQEAIKSAIEILTCIQMINVSDNSQRLQWFNEYAVYEERLRTLMEVGMDVNFRKVNAKRIAVYTETLANVGRQMSGWRRNCQSRVA